MGLTEKHWFDDELTTISQGNLRRLFLELEELHREVAKIKQDAQTKQKGDKESKLKFYYVESIDDYWIGQRLDNLYYAEWDDKLGFVWTHSRYLPWGGHVVAENTLWKEHTYPSEPVEIPFTKWIVGFMKKHSVERKGKWIDVNGDGSLWRCDQCKDTACCKGDYCLNCGADMRGEE